MKTKMNKKLEIWKRLIYKSGELFLTRRSGTLCRAGAAKTRIAENEKNISTIRRDN